MILTDVSDFLERVRAHNRETGHEIITANDVMIRHLGYSCSECGEEDEWGNTVWEISITNFRRTLPAEGLPYPPNSQRMLDHVNEFTRDRFFDGIDRTSALIPLATLEPNAGDMEWAVQHMNMPVQPHVRGVVDPPDDEPTT